MKNKKSNVGKVKIKPGENTITALTLDTPIIKAGEQNHQENSLDILRNDRMYGFSVT